MAIERYINQIVCFHGFAEVSFQNISLASEELHFACSANLEILIKLFCHSHYIFTDILAKFEVKSLASFFRKFGILLDNKHQKTGWLIMD